MVTAARNFGFVFRSRTPDSVSIVEMGQQHSYELLAILDFNNVRKRMSVIGTCVVETQPRLLSSFSQKITFVLVSSAKPRGETLSLL